MVKNLTEYICQQCDYRSPSFLGRCPNCGSWNSLVETVISPRAEKFSITTSKLATKPKKLSETAVAATKRLKTGIEEMDRVLGGGVVPGSVILLAGEPGIGKSTLLMQLAANFKSLYVAGEESPDQLKIRFDRIGKKRNDFWVTPETDVDYLITFIKEDFQMVFVDSIQTLTTQDLESPAGSISQVRECAYRLTKIAKEKGISVFLVGHVTKEGAIAGPKVLEHLVDCVLYLEGEKFHTFRILRSNKNRFGKIQEIGVFEMEEDGLVEVKDPSKVFLQERISAPGSVVVPVLEGSRIILTEVQALTNLSSLNFGKRVAVGFDPYKLQMLVATLSRRAALNLQQMDIFVNVVGGIKVEEPAADLGVALAIASSLKNKPISEQVVAFGEVGLLGEVRGVAKEDQRLEEAKRGGFKKFITPKNARTITSAIALSLS